MKQGTGKLWRLALALVLVLSFSLVTAVPALAVVTAPNLGTAASFAVLGTAVTLTNAIVTGDVGSTGANVTQTGSTITGTVYAGGAGAVTTAYSNFLSANGTLATVLVPDANHLTGTLAGVTRLPGVYSFDTAAKTGTLTLDASGNATAVWIFKSATPTGYLEGNSFSVVMANGGVASNVFWQVASYAALTTSNFKGTILAGAYITVTGGTFNGRALATAGVTLTGATASAVNFGPVELWHAGILINTYSKIQDAIASANATANDLIKVAAGTYPETVTLNKSLNVSGADKSTTIIDATGKQVGV